MQLLTLEELLQIKGIANKNIFDAGEETQAQSQPNSLRKDAPSIPREQQPQPQPPPHESNDQFEPTVLITNTF
jgi:hypothetical protein